MAIKKEKNKILHLPKMAQHFVKSLLSFNKYDNIVEQIIKEKVNNGKKRKGR